MEKENEILKFLESKFDYFTRNTRLYGNKNDSLGSDTCGEILEYLEEKFSNLKFSERDIISLSESYRTKENINLDIWEYETSRNHGNDMKKGDTEEYLKNKEKQGEINDEYQHNIENFMSVCEVMNDIEQFNDPSFDIEDKLFKPLYENKLKLKSRNPIINKYYETYKEKIEKQNYLENEIIALKDENADLQQINGELKQKNDVLLEKNTKLKKMLQKTIEFCQSVKKSRFGRFFFGKKIKALPEPEEDIMK